MPAFSRRPALAAVSLSLSLAAGFAAVTTPVAHAAPAEVCGGQVTDYVGGSALDTAFTGSVDLPGDTRTFSVTPLGAGSVVLQADISAPNNAGIRSAVGALTLRVNALGNGRLEFPVYAGKAYVNDVVCAAGSTRVTKMIGSVDVEDQANSVPFTLQRT
ncbi:hypothetical protein OK074_4673 [Actinobacteria bacterium OK074]|nr:hypothetical protein OK074_4673 [Actinobacteria bacterium OK074]